MANFAEGAKCYTSLRCHSQLRKAPTLCQQLLQLSAAGPFATSCESLRYWLVDSVYEVRSLEKEHC